MIESHLLTLRDREKVVYYLDQYPPRISELTFTNLYVWRHARPVWMTEIADSLVFLIDGGPENDCRKIMFGPPVGPASPLEIIKHFNDQIAGAIRLPRDGANIVQKSNGAVYEDRDNSDYVYRVEDLAKLSGRRYAKKRNLIKQCRQKYDCRYEPVSATNLEESKDVLDRWCKTRHCGDDSHLLDEYKAAMDAFAHFENFNLLGGAIRIDGKIEAFAIGEKLNRHTAVCHFEKAIQDFQGLSQLINTWFAKYALQGFEFVNREQDLGTPGLRQAKKSYYPDHFIVKYNTIKNPPKTANSSCVLSD